MSEMPGYTLEKYMEDQFNCRDGSPRHIQVVAHYEPIRESIETWLDDFNDDTQSWRGYRCYGPDDGYPDPPELTIYDGK